MTNPSRVTWLLTHWGADDARAINELMPLVQDNLHRFADKYICGAPAGQTLKATALVNEAVMRRINVELAWQSRAHFIAIAAGTMRWILVDHAKAPLRDKRGGDAQKVTL